MSPALAHVLCHVCYFSIQVCDFNTLRCVNMVSVLKQHKNSTLVYLTCHILARVEIQCADFNWCAGLGALK